MRSYPHNSPEAMARIVSMCIMADSDIDASEFNELQPAFYEAIDGVEPLRAPARVAYEPPKPAPRPRQRELDDIAVICHFDTNWGKNLEYLLQLPKGRFVLQLDSATDIFRAHDVLKGHCAIMGDVSAALFTVGTPDDVDAYARKLIGTFSNGEGLIYSSGCTLPMNARHENVKAFFDAVDKYGRYN